MSVLNLLFPEQEILGHVHAKYEPGCVVVAQDFVDLVWSVVEEAVVDVDAVVDAVVDVDADTDRVLVVVVDDIVVSALDHAQFCSCLEGKQYWLVWFGFAYWGQTSSLLLQ